MHSGERNCHGEELAQAPTDAGRLLCCRRVGHLCSSPCPGGPHRQGRMDSHGGACSCLSRQMGWTGIAWPAQCSPGLVDSFRGDRGSGSERHLVCQEGGTRVAGHLVGSGPVWKVRLRDVEGCGARVDRPQSPADTGVESRGNNHRHVAEWKTQRKLVDQRVFGNQEWGLGWDRGGVNSTPPATSGRRWGCWRLYRSWSISLPLFQSRSPKPAVPTVMPRVDWVWSSARERLIIGSDMLA